MESLVTLRRALKRATGAETSALPRVLSFANEGTLASFLSIFDPATKYAEAGDAVPAWVGQLHSQLRASLEAIIEERVRAAQLAQWQREAAGVRQVETTGRTLAGKSVSSAHLEFDDPRMLLALALLILASSAAGDLRRCRQCSGYFLALRTKGPRRVFCSNECMFMADRARAPERVRRMRQRQRKHK